MMDLTQTIIITTYLTHTTYKALDIYMPSATELFLKNVIVIKYLQDTI